ncbi:hypothetical protein Tco_0012477 [Tanacetum coccineum]
MVCLDRRLTFEASNGLQSVEKVEALSISCYSEKLLELEGEALFQVSTEKPSLFPATTVHELLQILFPATTVHELLQIKSAGNDAFQNCNLAIALDGDYMVSSLSLMDHLHRKGTCSLVHGGGSGSVVSGEELNTSFTPAVPLNVTPLIIVYPILDDSEPEKVVAVDVASGSKICKKRKKAKTK